jgi:uncharacterized membrane protein YeaQ/YmgE (transglycosylase-associated protein family)
MLYALIFWIIVGLIAGALAKAIMPGDDPGGIIVTIIIGIVGAVLGGWLLSLIGLGGGGCRWSVDMVHHIWSRWSRHTAGYLSCARGEEDLTPCSCPGVLGCTHLGE